MYFNTGHIIDIGLEGIVVELFCSFTSELILVSFVGVDSKEIKIKGRVVNAERDPHGKMRIGLSFEGSEQESRQFIAHIIRCNYLNKAAYQSLKN